MGLADIAAEVMPRVVAAYTSLVWEVSTRALPRNDSPPRVTWVPTSDTFGPPRKVGANGTVRHLFTCNASVRIHIWGESVSQVEALREAILASLHLSAAGSMSIGSGMWDAEQGQTNLGESYVFTVTFQVPQREAAASTVRLTAATPDNTTTTAGDGSLDHGEQ